MFTSSWLPTQNNSGHLSIISMVTALTLKKYLDKFIKYTISLPDTFKNGRSESCKTSVTYWLQLAKDSPSLSLIEKTSAKALGN